MKNNEIHSVLFELQKNLEDLESAKTHMEEFRNTSIKVVKGIDGVKSKYIEHLENVKTDYHDKTDQLQKELEVFLSDNKTQNEESLKKVVTTSEEIVTDGINRFKTVSESIQNSNNQSIKEVNNLLEHYKDVVEASSTLIETLRGIDFQTKLDALSTKSQLIIESILNAKQALEIRSNDSQTILLEKITSFQEQSRSNLDIRISELKEVITVAIEATYEKTNTLILNQNKEIKFLKTFLYIILIIIIIGIISLSSLVFFK